MKKLGRLLKLAWWAVVIGAVVQEAQKPAGERELHGTVAGFVPYDFRIPTPQRLRDGLWDPDGDVIRPQVFGVGWTLNLGRLYRAWNETKAV